MRMVPEPDIVSLGTESAELLALATDLLSEVGDLAGPSVHGFVEHLLDQWMEQPAGAHS